MNAVNYLQMPQSLVAPCNSLLTGLTKLQLVQTRQARLVMKSPPFTHSVPLLRSLPWLPVPCKVDFKICLLTCMTLREKQPVNHHSMLAISLTAHALRSNNGITLMVPRIKTSTGARAFHCRAPSLWNHLLLSVCSALSTVIFRKRLKTHLFDLAFSM